MAKATIDTLAADIQKILDKYADDVTDLTKDTVRKIGQKGVQALRSSSGVFGGSGKYASGWKSTVEETRMGSTATLHNAKVPGLPHLLEFGHALRGGGRAPGRVHIKPVEDELTKAFEREIEVNI
jgi:hypothetical protein